MSIRRWGWMCTVALLASGSLSARQNAPAPVTEKPGEKACSEKARDEKKAAFEDQVAQTKHTARIGGQEIKYAATAGTLVMKTEKSDAKAAIFYVADTLRDHITGSYYESGHMVYAHLPALAKLKQDTARFIRASARTNPGK